MKCVSLSSYLNTCSINITAQTHFEQYIISIYKLVNIKNMKVMNQIQPVLSTCLLLRMQQYPVNTTYNKACIYLKKSKGGKRGKQKKALV